MIKYLILIYYYSKRISLLTKKGRKTIIICFDGNFPHGGLVDRLKGIISFYEVAKLINSDFKIFFDHPFKLETFLEPNRLDWEIQRNEIKYSLFSTKVIYLINEFESNPLESVRKTKAKTIYVYCNVDYLKTLYQEKNEQDLNTIWQNSYKELFKPSAYLFNEINRFPDKNRIVFHTRFTSLMGDFKDTTSLELNESDKNNLIKKVIAKIDDFSIKFPDQIKFVLSDSETFLNYVRQNTVYKTLSGKPYHLENKNNDIEFNLKTFLDFYFMIESNMVCFICIDQMYNSNFSKYASVIGKNEFVFFKNV